jgi:hypothetical protein
MRPICNTSSIHLLFNPICSFPLVIFVVWEVLGKEKVLWGEEGRSMKGQGAYLSCCTGPLLRV